MKEADTKDTGSAAALRRLETKELSLYAEVEGAQAERDEAKRLVVDGDGDTLAHFRNAEANFLAALDGWQKVSKILLSFDKGVPKESREGEKILRTEAQEIFAQIRLSLTLGLESYIIRMADLCSQPLTQQEAHRLHAENLRDCFAAQIESAKREGAIPVWIAFE